MEQITRLNLFIVYILSVCIHLNFAANWAQITGEKLQNIAVVQKTEWTSRWGNAAGVVWRDPIESAFDEGTDHSKRSKIYMSGGDDHNIIQGGGTMRNDVWYTLGARYSTVESLLEFTFREDRYPKIVSNTQWIELASDLLPPPGVTYNEWLACAISNHETADHFNSIIPCNVTNNEEWVDKRFSPRRNHVMVGFNREIWILGGRARAHEDIPWGWEDTHGGIVDERVRWREESILKNDVWKSSDGVEWTLVNPGCHIPQQDETVHNGHSSSICYNDADCFGDSTCYNTTDSMIGTCICNMWQGRERHIAVVFQDRLWVMGGMSHIEVNKCGDHSCGGGYRDFMNDVWVTDDGISWEQMKPNVTDGRPRPHWRGRGEHAVVVLEDKLYLFGGRSGEVGDDDFNPYLNDFWVSEDGYNWNLISSDCGWEPRGNFIAGAYNGEITLSFGGNATGPLDDSWTTTLDNLDHWIQDFSWGETDQQHYVDDQRPLKYLHTMLNEEIEYMKYYDIHTFRQFYEAEWWIFEDVAKKFNYTNVCEDWRLVKRVVEHCDVVPMTYDGQEIMEDIIIVREGRGAPPEDEEVYTSRTIHPCFYLEPEEREAYGEDLKDNPSNYYLPPLNYTCAQVPSRRAYSAFAELDGKLYIFGGRNEHGYGTNDCWYRDQKVPRASYRKKPLHESSDTYFEFTTDEEWSVYEYQLSEIGEGNYDNIIRNWTIVWKSVDYIEWLESGEYQMEVRAIDPAGNIDLVYARYQNLYLWTYVMAPPWILIITLIVLFCLSCFGIYLEWKRRKRRAALERYAQKRMRRKFKKQAREAGGTGGDWKKYRDDAISNELSRLGDATDAKRKLKKKKRKSKEEEDTTRKKPKKERARDKKTNTKRTEEKKRREEKKAERRVKRKKERRSKTKRPT